MDGLICAGLYIYIYVSFLYIYIYIYIICFYTRRAIHPHIYTRRAEVEYVGMLNYWCRMSDDVSNLSKTRQSEARAREDNSTIYAMEEDG